MDSNKQKILMTLVVVIFITTVLGVLFKVKTNINKQQNGSDRLSEVTYCNPILSPDGTLMAYIKYNLSENFHAKSAEICCIDFKQKSRRKLALASLQKEEELQLTELSTERLQYKKTNYSTGMITNCIISLTTGKVEVLKSHFTDHREFTELVHPSDSTKKIEIFNAPYRLPGDMEQASFIKLSLADGSETSLAEPFGLKDFFHNAQWVGNNIVFQHKVLYDNVWQDRLIFYQTQTGKSIILAENCTNFKINPSGNLVAVLLPLNAQKSNKTMWELSIKRLEGESSVKLLANETFPDEIFLYHWNLNTLLFQRLESLYTYDMEHGTQKELANTQSQGWWNYPLSQYYLTQNQDGTQIAILSYQEKSDCYLEKITTMNMRGENKKVIFEKEITSFGKKLPFKAKFYQHILWHKDMIYFESKDSKTPSTSRILSVTADGSKKKILTGGLFSSF